MSENFGCTVSTRTGQCRLCLTTCDDIVNVFEHFNGSTIAAVLTKHFWFQVYKNDGYSECLCQLCWTTTKTFHNFYKRIESVQKDYEKGLTDNRLAIRVDLIKQELCDSPRNETQSSDLSIVKCEVTLAFPLPVIEDESAYYNENELNDEDQSLNREVAKDEPEDDPHDIENRGEQPNQAWNPSPSDSAGKTVRRAKLKLPESAAFQCALCTSAFAKAFELANHLRSQHHSGKDKTEETIHCELCKKRFVTLSLLTKHIRKVHEGESPQVCSKCSRAFNSKTSCDTHMQLEHANDDDQYNTLQKEEGVKPDKIRNDDDEDSDEATKSSNPNSLSIRSREEKEEENALIREYFNMTCELCSEEFSTLIEVRKHYREVHNVGGYIICCGKRFHRRYRILSHIEQHINPNAFRCEQCSRSFSDKVTLQTHLKSHKPDESSNFQCTECNCKFLKRCWLTKHMRKLHHQSAAKGTVEKTFECDSCKKSFLTKISLVGHIRRIHQQVDKQICDICAWVCYSKSSLRNHMLEHSKTAPDPEEQCHICGNWLKHQRGLRKHLARHHDDFVNCPICEKRIQNKQSLNSHMRSAHGERTHQCALCDKAFKTPLILKEHMASHTGVDLYNCQYCPKTFKSSANLYSHRKKMHFDEWNRDFPKRCNLLTKTSNSDV